jgi:hypothetical protein
MRLRIIAMVIAACSLLLAQGPEYTPDGKLLRPADYREWIFLSAGLGMTYGNPSPHEQEFSNVFVSPPAYREFLKTGHWPEKTMFLLEVRRPESHGSINKGGYYQSEMIGLEAEVKDSTRFPDTWAYFSFSGTVNDPKAPARMFPKASVCIQCHAKNAAVENTFVQFYPTLLEVARHYGTLRSQ